MILNPGNTFRDFYKTANICIVHNALLCTNVDRHISGHWELFCKSQSCNSTCKQLPWSFPHLMYTQSRLQTRLRRIRQHNDRFVPWNSVSTLSRGDRGSSCKDLEVFCLVCSPAQLKYRINGAVLGPSRCCSSFQIYPTS